MHILTNTIFQTVVHRKERFLILVDITTDKALEAITT